MSAEGMLSKLREMAERSTCHEFDDDDQAAVGWAVAKLEPDQEEDDDQEEDQDHAPCEACGSLSFLLLGRSLRRVLLDVAREREGQDRKWGRLPRLDHDAFFWLSILGEEVGEAHQAALHDRVGGPAAGTLRDELIQVAAVAVAIAEDLHLRGGGSFEDLGAVAQVVNAGDPDSLAIQVAMGPGDLRTVQTGRRHGQRHAAADKLRKLADELERRSARP